MGFLNSTLQQQQAVAAQPWYQEYQQAYQAMRMSGDYDTFKAKVNEIASKYPDSDKNLLGDTAGKAVAGDQDKGGMLGVPMVDRYLSNHMPETTMAVMAAITGGAAAGAGGAASGAEAGVGADTGMAGLTGTATAAAPASTLATDLGGMGAAGATAGTPVGAAAGGSGVNYLTGEGVQTGFGASTGSSAIPGAYDTLSGWSPVAAGGVAGGVAGTISDWLGGLNNTGGETAGGGASYGGAGDYASSVPGESVSNSVTAGTGAGTPDWGQMAKIFGPSVANGLINLFQSNRTQHQASDLLGRTNPLDQAQRFPFQAQANDLMSNPQNYMQNNPFAKSLTDLYKNNVIPANIAKSGNTGFEADRLGSQFASTLSGNYNNLAQILSGYGGYTQGAPSGAAAVPLLTQSNQNFGEMFRGTGDAASKIFGTPSNPQMPQANPITGSYNQPG